MPGVRLEVLGFWGGYPGPEGASAGYLLHGEQGGELLLDCGSGVLSRLLESAGLEGLRRLEAVLLTHLHHDHAADLGVLSQALVVESYHGFERAPLPVYVPEGALERARFYLAGDPWSRLRPLRPGEVVTVGAFRVEAAPARHPVPALALRVEEGGRRLVYTGDTAASAEVEALAAGADLLLAEASHYEGEDGSRAGHLTAPEAGAMARRAGVARLVLTHLPHYGDLEELEEQARRAFGGPTGRAHSGLVVEVGAGGGRAS
ncbi:MAG: MBL fold metallo-hydrolase [Clostridia bacterium]|nr:MBL fold metallo-hydrolase [Clostridia bacterium]MCL6521309.1 MBL fold metallo-hydrolase [Bacillota bacterium]